MGNGVDLVRPQGDFRIHARKTDVAAIILTGTNRIKGFIVKAAQQLTPVNIFPYPFREFLLEQLLTVLRDCSFLLVQDRLSVAVFILHIIKYPHIPLV